MEDRNNIIVSGEVTTVASTNRYNAWHVPTDSKFVRIVCIGGGGGGSAGDISAAGAASFGGAGGGSGGFTSVIIPTKYLPPVLFLQPGYGGAGSTTSQNNGAAGVSGGPSVVYGFISSSTVPIITANGGQGGQATAGVNPMNGGAGGTTVGNRNILSYFCSNFINLAGLAGQNGGNADVSGTAFSALQSHFLCGGAGASGSSTTTAFAGQTITGAGELPTIAGGALSTATSAATRPEGGSGVWLWKPMMGTGGAGGGSTITTNGFGGRGGDGAYGCGGGGGGGASGTGVTAGPGGNGGPGLIIINCW